MTQALNRFSFYTHHLAELLQTANRKRDSKGYHFYKAGARNTIFRLEGLCRLYRDVADKKIFDPWYKEFKSLEDTLGAMDHHESMLTEFIQYKPLKKYADKILKAQLDNETAFLDDVLKNKDWLNGNKLKAFTDMLNTYDWKPDDEDASDFAKGMLSELQKLDKKYRAGEIDLSLLEEGVHEFRRRLRWVSIYAACANGLVQLRQVKIYGEEFKQYCTKEVTSSPFNKLPKPTRNTKPIYIQAHHFYAMSWLINLLGELKDIGIRAENFHAICASGGVDAKKLDEQFLSSCKYHPNDITALAELAADRFVYAQHIMERLQRDLLRYIATAS